MSAEDKLRHAIVAFSDTAQSETVDSAKLYSLNPLLSILPDSIVVHCADGKYIGPRHHGVSSPNTDAM